MSDKQPEYALADALEEARAWIKVLEDRNTFLEELLKIHASARAVAAKERDMAFREAAEAQDVLRWYRANAGKIDRSPTLTDEELKHICIFLEAYTKVP